jgi:hypothetical protein
LAILAQRYIQAALYCYFFYIASFHDKFPSSPVEGGAGRLEAYNDAVHPDEAVRLTIGESPRIPSVDALI